jgi:predicted TIM-barrel fold metal-dependent hydrolase
VRRAFRYAERPNRFLYGSDWPLAPLAPYRDFIRSVVPAVYHAQVFQDNARGLFRLSAAC